MAEKRARQDHELGEIKEKLFRTCCARGVDLKPTQMIDTTSSALSDKPVVMIIAEPGIVADHINSAIQNANDLMVLGPFPQSVEGISKLRRQHVDAIIIDIGMRHENAQVIINRIMKIDQDAKIIMTATLSFTNVKKSMTGFDKGAAGFIQTPADFTQKKSKSEFNNQLMREIRLLAQARRKQGVRRIDGTRVMPKPPSKPAVLRPFQERRPDVIAIASSTGGPQALYSLLEHLTLNFGVPVLITQHMPKTFTTVLANNLSVRTGKKILEATDGAPVLPGTVYIAPGDFHMTVVSKNNLKYIKLTQDPPINFCRPSADPMLESIARAYGAKVCVVVLTGMGKDGKDGAKLVVDSGGQVIAQDFETSAVWGMPGAVADAGYCSKILPLDSIAPLLNSLLTGRT